MRHAYFDDLRTLVAKRANKHRRGLKLESLESRNLLAADPVISEFVASNDGQFLDGDGDASDWLEISNQGDEPVDLQGWYLSDNSLDLQRFELPNLEIAPDSFVVLFASGKSEADGNEAYVDSSGHIHTNFRLSVQGESLVLSDSTGTIVDGFQDYPKQRSGVSYGQKPDGEPAYFVLPTPGATNDESIQGFVADTTFDVDRGFFDEPFVLTVQSKTPGASLIFTLDGSAPSVDNGVIVDAASETDSPVLQTPIDTTTTVRAIAVKEGYRPSNVDTQTYIFLEDVIRQSQDQDGLPSRWDGRSQSPIRADYEMDPEIVDDPDYSADLLAGLREIPTLSLVLDPDDMFGEEGIYINSGQRGRDWERPTSIEIIEPDGTSFQTDTGVRIHGFSWRFHSNTPKHSFRLEFRDEYGPTKLDYPLFPDSPVDRFDSIVLRAQGGRAWAGQQNPSEAQYLRDTFARDLSRELGRTDGHATHVHLYINGLYWGLYNPVERPDAQFGEEYFGGSHQQYDALNRRTSTVEVIDGDADRYNAMMRIVNQALRADTLSDAQYRELESYVAIDEFIEFMLLNQYVTNRDGVSAFEGNNQRAIGYQGDDPQFRFFVWDMEYSMWNATDNNNVDQNSPRLAGSNNPSNGVWALYNALRLHPEFRLRYADNVRTHLFHQGALTPERASETWETRARGIENAVVAESARWGDAKRRRPYTRDVEWQRERNRLLTTYFPRRSEILVDHLKEVDLYTQTVVPEFFVDGVAQHGGRVETDSSLTIVQNAQLNAEQKTLIGDDSVVAAWVPTDDRLADTWQQADFQPDAAWSLGENGVGFDNSGDYNRKLNIDVRDAMRSNASVYVRIPFEIESEAELAAITKLTMPLLIDDGFVAYLNGNEVASQSAPSPAQWNSSATSPAEANLSSPLQFDLTEFVDQLRVGRNVLAIHGMNAGTASGDMIVHANLIAEATIENSIWFTTDGSDPRLPGGEINSPSRGGTAQLYSDGISLSQTTQLKARAVSFEGSWSALETATFVVGSPVVVSEIHYHPADPTNEELAALPGVESGDFEFVELLNPTEATLSLANARFTNGIDLIFPANAEIAAGERAVIVSNHDAFRLRYGEEASVLAEYSGQLNNGGERLAMVDAVDEAIADLEYNDSMLWPQAADGVGASLELIEPASDIADYSHPTSWKQSREKHGSPGQPNSTASAVIISEVVSRTTDEGMLDAIELRNTTDSPIDIGGWYLSDSQSDLQKLQIPIGTLLGPGDFVVFDETDFNPTPAAPEPWHFALSGTEGENVWLVTLNPNASVDRFIDHVSFGPSRDGESLVRIGNIPRMMPSSTPSLGETNSSQRIGPVFISEIQYNPGPPSQAALAIDPDLEPEHLEFVEVSNPTDEPTTLANWQIAGGISFQFPPVDLAPGSSLIVLSFNPANADRQQRLAAFRSHYQIDAQVQVVGGYAGRLSDRFDRVELLRPETHPTQPNELIHTSEDFAVYGDSSPWPEAADGNGESLNRRSHLANGISAANWSSALPTPGVTTLDTIPGDMNHDRVVDLLDLNLLCAAIHQNDLAGDLNNDGTTDLADQDFMVEQLLGSVIGDANLDGEFNSTDLVQIFQNGGYENNVDNDASWDTGDWNCDGEFSTSDLVLAFQLGNYQ